MSKAGPWGHITEPMPRAAGRSPRIMPGGKRPLVVLFALLLALGAASTGLAYYSSTYEGKIYRGVSVMGVDVSGRTPDQARQLLLARAAQYANAPLMFRQSGQSWQVTPRQLGLALDVDPLLQQAYSQDRSGSQLDKLRQRVPLVGSSVNIEPKYQIGRSGIEAYLRGLAPQIERKPVNSELSIRRDGALVATADRDGRKLDMAKAVGQVHAALGSLSHDDIELPVLSVRPAQTREEWRNGAALRRAIADEPVQLRLRERRWMLGPEELASAITTLPRDGEKVGRFASWRMAELLKPVAADVQREPANARLEIEDAAPVLTPEKLGEKLNVQASARAVYAALREARPARLETDPVPAALTAADLNPTAREIRKLLGSPLTLKHEDTSWTVEPETLQEWLDLNVSASTRSASVELREEKIRQYLVSEVADEIRREPVGAELYIEDAKPVLDKEIPGEELVADATVRSIVASLSGSHETPLVTRSVPAVLVAADLSSAKSRLDTLLRAPVSLQFEGKSWTVPVQTLAGWTEIETDAQARTASIELDESEVWQYMQEFAPQVNQAPVDGRLTWRDGLVVLSQSQDGYTLDVEKATDGLLASAFAENRILNLPVTVTKPRVPTDNLAALGIKEPIGEGTSAFKGSRPERIHNIKTAAGYIGNTVIAPGETFSFVDAIGSISKARGYREGLTIVGDETVPGIGGGVCQVSTTTFRAVFWAGLPIDERNQHSYLVSFYQQDGSPPGFDAAVYRPWVDFKWTNNTDHHILLQAYWTDDSLRMVLYGTDPEVDVYRSQPHITNRKPPLPSKTIVDPKLKPGAREQKEWAHEGMDVVLYRTVKKNGKVLFRDSFYSSYRPWGDVWMVGPPKKKPATTPPTRRSESTSDPLRRLTND